MYRFLIWIVLFLAIGYRFWLWDVFAGWEESDYGNIAMIRGVFESGFQSYDMNHMPGYYGLAALFLFIHDDAVIAGKLASTMGGGLALVGVTLLMKRMAGVWPSILLGLVLVIQPEFSLYSASALREPVYSMFVVGVVWSTILKRWWVLGIFAGCAFLVRFEFPLVLIPLFFLISHRHGWRSLIRICIPLISSIVAWMLYCIWTYETPAFWAHAASSNIDTGMGAEALHHWDWFIRGLSIVVSLLFSLLPERIGWLIWGGWMLSPVVVPKESRVWFVLGLSYGLVGVWLLIAFIAQHDPTHNLYWKWMYPLVPIVSFCGIWTLWRIISARELLVQRSLWIVILVTSLFVQFRESQIQIDRAHRLYQPQIDLATKIEKEVPAGRLLLVDNIPACWMNRKVHEYRLISWFDVPVSPSDTQGFAAWLAEEDVWAVLWFREDWTQAPTIAPFLAKGGEWEQDGQILVEETREEEYGWIFYKRKSAE